MSALLDHVWGVSPAQDYIWAQVAGMAPSLSPEGRLFAVFQAFIDDSYRPECGNFTLAGHIASAKAWAEFSKDWEEMLPFGLRDEAGYYFHMVEMATLPERMARVPAFYRIIEKHVLLSLSCTVSIPSLSRAMARMWVPNTSIDFGYLLNPYLIASPCLLDQFHYNKHLIDEILPADQAVDFYFDEKTKEEQFIRNIWSSYLANRTDDIRKRFGEKPQFKDDRKFLPLQAADLWAWWVRKWYDEGAYEKVGEGDFGEWRINRKDLPRIDIFVGEDAMVRFLKTEIRSMVGSGRIIYDVQFSHPKLSQPRE